MPIKQTVPTNSGDYLQFGNATTPVAAAVGGYEDSTGNGHLELYTTASGTVTERVRVDSAGNVGIGTSSLNEIFNVYKASNAFIAIQNSTTGTAGSRGGFIGMSGSQMQINNKENESIVSFTNGSERMRIDSSGNVLVGVAAQMVDEKFGVDQTTASRPAIIARAATTGVPAFKTIKTTNVNNTTQYHLTFTYNNGANGNGAIVGNGDSQAAFASFSDARLKKNIEDLPSQLDKIIALRPVEFDYIKSGEHQIGFIAQEVQEVYPDLVAEGEDEMLTVTGLGKTEARLIKAIQELSAKVTALEAQLGAK